MWHRSQFSLLARGGRAQGQSLRRRFLAWHAAPCTGAVLARAMDERRADPVRRHRIHPLRAARRHLIRPLLQYHAAPSRGVAARMEAAASGRTRRHHDGKLPSGLGGKLVLPFSLWLMKRTMLGNPFIKPWNDLAAIADTF